ncbi:DUF805 domain-containing protein [Asticcacaulis sp. 201]|uniref:DUF805 domain-containing protein n=1 Tax=Asticcacaulis sp. 201 TaxID=3028787 RepID=UPI0029164526|nr:DUF805 domain-containing protein [Asticcacaulis sp. 201]MDV6329978.1 DUF805 domain-containing protein [Asticcacaulis sp. 201]
MQSILHLFSLKSRLNRKAFWLNWLVLFVISICLASIWLRIDGDEGVLTATLVILPFRLPVLVQQVSMYVRRLRDAGMLWAHVLFLLAVYTVMTVVALYLAPAAIDARAECQLTGFDNCGDADGFEAFTFLFGIGPLTGLPGPLSFFWALSVGLAKPRGRAVASASPAQ